MRRSSVVAMSGVLLVLTGALAVSHAINAADPVDPATVRKQAAQLAQDGNWKEAYDRYRELCLAVGNDVQLVSNDLQQAVQCLNRLGQTDAIDELLESTIKGQSQNWQLLQAAGQIYLQIPHQGFVVAGEFQRGWRQERGKAVNTLERDRTRALQLFEAARKLAADDNNKPAVSSLLTQYAQALLTGAGYLDAWRLQILTDLTALPDLEDGYFRGGRESRGAPVDVDGNPVLHRIPLTFEAAASDGERWRWLLAEATRLSPQRTQELKFEYAQFLHQQFGVQTMAQFSWWRSRNDAVQDRSSKNGTFELHTLAETETIARLATGVKRFSLPDEHNFLKLFQQIAAADRSSSSLRAGETLCQIFENRRQYPQAAAQWRALMAQHGANNDRNQRLQQIVGNWGRFETAQTQPSGRGAVVDYRFRNGNSVMFEAFPVDVEKLITDVKSYLKSNPPQLEWQQLNLSNLGYRLITENQEKYLKPRSANWTVPLTPRPGHVDDRITVTTPLQQPGAYLLTAKMDDGNVSRIVVWVADTAIVQKNLDGKVLYYVADALDGKPVARANVEFIGWDSQYQRVGQQNRAIVETRNFVEFTNADGQLLIDQNRADQRFQWLIVSRSAGRGVAFLGFERIWFGQRHDPEYNETKVYTVTDRPVYRPGQKVQYKFWLRHAQYDQEDNSQFASRPFNVIVENPNGEKVIQKQIATDEFGGIADEFTLEDEAQLGAWQVYIEHQGGGSFRVEEYKKPEFEVTVDAPERPVQLGEKITAKITAKYYFGAPVTNATVKYKVQRTTHDSRWYPRGRWDWFYEPGYWWFVYNADWYPGWSKWGCRAPVAWWWPRQNDPPEVVAEAEVEIGDDGTVSVEIDTRLAQEIHGDDDHRYEITVEVVDESRRTIVGSGAVLVARKPFQVFAWLDRGHFRAGDDVTASFQAQTLDQKPVSGPGVLKLFRVSYADAPPDADGEAAGRVAKEQLVQQWELASDAFGQARQQFRAAEPGQYRLSYTVTDAAEHAIEGGYLFTVTGNNFTGDGFRFNDVELIPEKREYKAGENVRLMVNTAQRNATVLLFLRPTNGVYLPPQLLRLEGNSTVYDFGITKRDMPNFFVEAVTVSSAKVHTETREIVVPPESRVLNVEVAPSKETYKPGEAATVQVKLTDSDGKPFVGSTVMSVYDRSLEYISGGSNVPEIREFFWKWRRQHHPQTLGSLERSEGNVIRPGEIGMNNIGVFGGAVVEELAQGRGARMLRKAGMAMPASEAAGAPMTAMADGVAFGGNALARDAAGEAPENLVQPTVRSNFADTAFWTATLTTNADGVVTVNFPMPENLTAWKIRVWGMGHGTRVGEGTSEVVTAKNLLVRLQAPRFFVEKDEVVLTANVHNYLSAEKAVQVVLELEGGTLGVMHEAGDGPLPTTASHVVTIPANGELRVDWRVKVLAEGEAVVRMKALTDEESDAMQMTFPCFVHGMLKTESWSGVVRPADPSQVVTLAVPEERRPGQTRLELRYSPTLAAAMVDALPYLAEYPYGCTEQTLNRFIPTVITQRILQRMNLDLAAIRDKRTNLNAQEIGDDVERAKRWKMFDRNPVFDEAEVVKMAKSGVDRLTSMQNSDGGWGWFSGSGERSYAHTTAVVVHGLQVAVQNDLALVPGTLERGVEWLTRHQASEIQKLKNALLEEKVTPWKSHADNLDAFVFLILNDAGIVNGEMRDFLYRDRTDLAVYGKALLGLALHAQKENEKLAMILRNIEQFVVEDAENQTAYLKLLDGNSWWYWWGNDVEANAWYLKLLAATNPKSERAAGLVKYILNNRRHGTYWRSTRDTALCIEALADYLKASGEDRPGMTIEVLVDGELRKSVKVDASNLFSFDNRLVLEGDELASGEHRVEVRRQGRGPVYFNAYLTNFTLEDFITRAGLEVKVQRRYYRLKEVAQQKQVAGSRGQAVSQKVEKFEREELADLALLKSGELVEVELEIESKNDYEYLLFEDPKAAGFEPLEVRSGYNGNEMGAYVEYRDERVALFVRWLPRGRHSMSYRLRAEIPGRFSALPTKASAMYAPELKANSDEIRLRIED